jgi:hypothetical protein
MPYTLKVEGMEEITAMLAEAEESAQGIAALALFEGAGIIADAISKEARGLRTAPFKYAAGGVQREASPEEKAILLQEGAAGIARFDKTGNYVGTAVGYNRTGYANVKWNHMSSKARTNYKQMVFKGKAHTSSSLLKTIRDAGGSEKYGLSKDIGRGVQDQKPVAVIASAINSGTSFMKKQPFIRKAATQNKAKAEAAIMQKVQELVERITRTA